MDLQEVISDTLGLTVEELQYKNTAFVSGMLLAAILVELRKMNRGDSPSIDTLTGR